MAMNRFQFQERLPLREFLTLFGTDELCAAHLVRLRGLKASLARALLAHALGQNAQWPSTLGVLGLRLSVLLNRGLAREHAKLPLHKRFLRIYLVKQRKNAISALEHKRQVGNSYPAAWLMKHKILETMHQCEQRRVLDERVEIDDPYLGGERSTEKRGRGAPNKVAFVAAVQTSDTGKPYVMRLSSVSGFTAEPRDFSISRGKLNHSL